LQSETVVQTKRRHFIVFYVTKSSRILGAIQQSWPGASPTQHFE